MDIEKVLVSLGLTGKAASILYAISDNYVLNSQEIERCTDLRQSEVSIILSDLLVSGWLYVDVKQMGGKGRSTKFYKLRLSLQEIVEELIKDFDEKQKREKEQIEELMK